MAGSGRRAASRPTTRSMRFIHRTGTPVTVYIPPTGAPDADAISRCTPSGMGRSPARGSSGCLYSRAMATPGLGGVVRGGAGARLAVDGDVAAAVADPDGHAPGPGLGLLYRGCGVAERSAARCRARKRSTSALGGPDVGP